MRRMEDAKKMYEEIPVPEELSGRVLEAVEQAGRTFWERITADMPESRSRARWKGKGQRMELYFLRTGSQRSVWIRHFT